MHLHPQDAPHPCPVTPHTLPCHPHFLCLTDFTLKIPLLQSWTQPRTFCFQSLSPQRSSRLHFPRSLCRFQTVTDNVNSHYHIQQTTADSTSGISKRFWAEKQFFSSGHIWQQWSTQWMAKALFLDRQVTEHSGVNTPRVAAHPTIFAFTLTHTIKKNALHLWKAQVFVKASTEPSGFDSSLLLLILHMPWFSLCGSMPELFFNCCWEKCTF